MKPWDKQEKRIAEQTGGSRNAASGAFSRKGDVRAGKTLIEAKWTGAASYTIRASVLEKNMQEAILEDRVPVLALELNGRNYAIVEWDDFLEFCERRGIDVVEDLHQVCSDCHQNLRLNEENFYLDPSRSSGFHSRCKDCYRKRGRERHRKQWEWYDSLKQGPCTDCQQAYPPYVMDWDHVRGQKVACVAHLMMGPNNKERVLEEIQKCDLVCANCHRERTHQRRRDAET